MKKLVCLLVAVLSFISAFAQPVEMADAMRSSGKIYVVIGTIAIVFAGLAIYLFVIDKRLRKIENNKY
ncbi:CcmD family protein [Mucilaginibacter robiniae]|uniref:CcmD family protein n=1 Tax=Mucilaginibacter robiniae TaxID=2728022 RepID=A0A7L5E3T3_9SPHI|nr:CcmD family protein [Mucilaginibacter robiniae]QJD97990.1 CcmD family protein [Mucilaginibacter robiniae]